MKHPVAECLLSRKSPSFCTTWLRRQRQLLKRIGNYLPTKMTKEDVFSLIQINAAQSGS
jgi:hypothetical protein